MRTHNDAAKMMGQRARAAAGFGGEPSNTFRQIEVEPDGMVRMMLADLVPFEELDSVMSGVAASADSMAAACGNVFAQVSASFAAELDGDDDDETTVSQERFMARFLEHFASTAFVGLGQEITYALLMANAKPVVE